MLKLVLRSSCPPTLLQFSHPSQNTRSPSLPSVPSIGTVQENKRSASEGTTLCQSELSRSRRDALNCILQRSRSLFSQSLPVTSALCVESAHIDPASDKHVLGGKLLESQHAGVGRLLYCRTRITKRLISEHRMRGCRGTRTGWREREMKLDEKTERKWRSGHYLLLYEPQIVHRQTEASAGCWFFSDLTLPCLLSLVKPRPNHKPPCVISQQCFRPPGLMAQCSLYDMRRLTWRSVLLFSTNLIPTLFKHCFFSCTHNEEFRHVFVSPFVCVCERERDRERQQ